MSEFNRNNDPANRPIDPTINDPYAADQLARRPVVVEQRNSGTGMIVGALVLAAIAFGGYYAYNHSASVRTAANNVTASATPAPPAAIPDNTARPASPVPQSAQ